MNAENPMMWSKWKSVKELGIQTTIHEYIVIDSSTFHAGGDYSATRVTDEIDVMVYEVRYWNSPSLISKFFFLDN